MSLRCFSKLWIASKKQNGDNWRQKSKLKIQILTLRGIKIIKTTIYFTYRWYWQNFERENFKYFIIEESLARTVLKNEVCMHQYAQLLLEFLRSLLVSTVCFPVSLTDKATSFKNRVINSFNHRFVDTCFQNIDDQMKKITILINFFKVRLKLTLLKFFAIITNHTKR